MYKFELKQLVKVSTHEIGKIIGRSEYLNVEPSYLVRYTNGVGNMIENWWTERALEAL